MLIVHQAGTGKLCREVVNLGKGVAKKPLKLIKIRKSYDIVVLFMRRAGSGSL